MNPPSLESSSGQLYVWKYCSCIPSVYNADVTSHCVVTARRVCVYCLFLEIFIRHHVHHPASLGVVTFAVVCLQVLDLLTCTRALELTQWLKKRTQEMSPLQCTHTYTFFSFFFFCCVTRSIIWREVPRNSREGYDSRTQEFIERGRDRPLDVLEVDDVRQELEKAPGDGSTGRVTFEDDGWFGPLLVR